MKKKRYTVEMNNIYVNLKKSILLVLTFGLFSMSSFGSYYPSQGSELTISLWERSAEFVVVLDGHQQRGQGVVKLDHIKPGKHHIKVIQLHRSRCSNERGKTLLHQGLINIPKNSRMKAVVEPRRGMQIVQVQSFAVINQHDGYHYDNQYEIDQYGNVIYDNQYHDNYNDCNGCNAGCNECRPVISQCGTVEPIYPNYESNCDMNTGVSNENNDLYTQYMIDHGMYNDNSSTMPSGYYGSFMSEYELEHLIKELEDAWFDSDRIKLAKRRIKAKNVTSAQVLEIIQQFSFESSRLAVAKYAYEYTVDKDNYYEVNTGFEFSSSINDLEESIYN